MLRAFEDRDAAMVRDLATDPYVPLVATLVAGADEHPALTYIAAQRTRHDQGLGYSFCVAAAASDEALGTVGLWLRDLHEGRATAGHSVAPAARGHGVAADALVAVTALAWGIRALHRVSLHIEPWNRASLATPPSGPATTARACCAAGWRSTGCGSMLSRTPPCGRTAAALIRRPDPPR